MARRRRSFGGLFKANRGHRRGRRRRYGRNPPEFSEILSHPTDVIVPGLVATGAAIGVVTIGNYVQQQFLSSMAGSFTGSTGILMRAAVRGGVAYAGDFLVKGSPYQGAYRTGVVVGIVGSAVLDFLGKSFTLGLGDTAQTPQSILGLAGAGAYVNTRGMRGMDAYTRARLNGLGGVNRGPQAASMHRLYGGGI